MKNVKKFQNFEELNEYITQLDHREELDCLADVCAVKIAPCGVNACIAHVLPCLVNT